MKFLTLALLMASTLVNAGTITANAGPFIYYSDPTAWASAHPNAQTVDLSGEPTGANSTNLAIGDFNITGSGIYIGQIGNTQALFTDTSHGVGLDIIVNPSIQIYSMAFWILPLPVPWQDVSMVIANTTAGTQLVDYEYLTAPYFFGVDSPGGTSLGSIYVNAGFGQGVGLTGIALQSLEVQTSSDTPESGTVWLLAGPLLAGILKRLGG